MKVTFKGQIGRTHNVIHRKISLKLDFKQKTSLKKFILKISESRETVVEIHSSVFLWGV